MIRLELYVNESGKYINYTLDQLKQLKLGYVDSDLNIWVYRTPDRAGVIGKASMKKGSDTLIDAHPACKSIIGIRQIVQGEMFDIVPIRYQKFKKKGDES